MSRSAALLAGLSYMASLIVLTAGCSDCEPLCSFTPPDDVVTFTGRLEQLGDELDDGASLFIAADETPRAVLITGRVGALEVGTTYIVNATDAGGLLRTSVPADCSCGPNMTNSDGTEIDTSSFGQLLPNIQLTAVLAVTVIGFAALAYFAWRSRDPDFDEYEYYEDEDDWDDTGA